MDHFTCFVFQQAGEQDKRWADAARLVHNCLVKAHHAIDPHSQLRSYADCNTDWTPCALKSRRITPAFPFASVGQQVQQWVKTLQFPPPAHPRQQCISNTTSTSVQQPILSDRASNTSLWDTAETSKDAGDSKAWSTGDEPDHNAIADERVLISEVEVRGVEGELKQVAEAALTIKPNFAYTFGEVKEDIGRVFATGYFQRLNPIPEDTRDGVKLTIEVIANPELRGLVLEGGNVLPSAVVEDAFKDQYGKTLNIGQFREGLRRLDQWYHDKGFLGSVVGVDMDDGTVSVRLAEAVVQRLNLQYLNSKTGEIKDDGKTRPEVILRQLCTAPGQVYNVHQGKRDIDAVFSMDLFDDVNLVPTSVDDDDKDGVKKVDLTLTVSERKSGGFSAGGGISGAGHADGVLPGFIGSMAYSQRNLFGLNQKLTASVEIGQVDSLYRIVHTDPWVAGDAYRTSRTVSLQNTRTSGNAIHSKAPDDAAIATSTRGDASAGPSTMDPAEGPAETDKHPAGDGNVVVARVVGGIEYGRPLATGWSGTLGVNWQQARCLNEHGVAQTQDVYGAPLTFSGQQSDAMMLAVMRAVYSDLGNSALVSMEQAVPLSKDWLNFNRFRARGEKTIPVGPCKILLSGKGGVIIGDLPPYEAFPLGGTNSVRGYSEGGVGSGRNFVSTTAELHLPLTGPLVGTIFADYGSDLDSGASVLGDPAGARGKPGSGYGYGVGVRVDSPVGPLRLEYALNDKGKGRFHLGIGSHG